ncbi:DNA polymerase III subunit gamma/tau [Pseudoluteimonas lycopersici]|uniref:DNA polymerase III subunit gamma/tau n=1 Tax=Pseudoluteimonas lycopersici TaxID=1324796 RepID=A0A516V240_9GAMM|nr:DNA polymerase III subunit gamma/tau [Lysobacter lycopersici]QDQ72599.1 DNA polymerase III subunit gamma/tau [Lysobacter lycopersici]
MSYLVLARKWRPRRFAELVGQEHVVRALTNALETGRVHHAFLFTGTRGVGKTTIARIFAKSLNCERGTSADPCGECETCLAIDAGRYIDLLEIDAASNTGVDDVRELIDNAQYMPSRGRTKVYLIDEVHMLSKAAFNALLKTLEEPPGHVKFLLATTDPQKLPVTVLSRCLQFNLKRLDQEQIRGQIAKILAAEGISAEDGAVQLLARGADGSLRDGLSLLDQAIAYTGGKLEETQVAAMLGTVDRTRVGALLEALADADGARLLDEVAKLAEFAPDWGDVLDALASALHRIQVKQLVPEATVEADGIDAGEFASKLRPELVQLWYQMALDGRRELPLAPAPRAGFEMALLRMFAFRPDSNATQTASAPNVSAAPPRSAPPATPRTAPPAPAPRPMPEAPAASPAPAAQRPAAPMSSIANLDADGWLELVAHSGVRGPAAQLAAHSGFVSYADGVLRLTLAPADEHLKGPAMVRMLAAALEPQLGVEPQIKFELAEPSGETLHVRNERQRDARQAQAEDTFMNDPDVRRMLEQGAKLVPDSIRPLDDA